MSTQNVTNTTNATATSNNYSNYFTSLDTNNDGFISIEEARASGINELINNFDQLDIQNKDGKLTVTEFSQKNWEEYLQKLKSLIDSADKRKFSLFFGFSSLRKLGKFIGVKTSKALGEARKIYAKFKYQSTLNKINGSALSTLNFNSAASGPIVKTSFFFRSKSMTLEDFSRELKKAQKSSTQALTDQEIKDLYDLYAGVDGKLSRRDWRDFLKNF